MESFLKKIVTDAGDEVLKRFGKSKVKYTKVSALDVVTDADIVSNNLLVSRIQKKYPNHGIISEELDEAYKPESPYQWIIDPLDGSGNFASKTPLFAVMAALVYKGEVILSAIYSPFTKELLFSKKGKGVFLNGKKVSCSKQPTWEDSWGTVSSTMAKRTKTLFSRVLSCAQKEACRISAFGSIGVSVIHVASGRRDWLFSRIGPLWDSAPAYLALKEAGCTVTDLEGKPWTLDTKKGMIASNKKLHALILSTAFKRNTSR